MSPTTLHSRKKKHSFLEDFELENIVRLSDSRRQSLSHKNIYKIINASITLAEVY